jgi:hypothetical protein
MSLTRRTILGGIAATAAPLPAVAAPAPVLSPQERIRAAIEELREAVYEANPGGITKWQVHYPRDEEDIMRVMVLAFNN